MSKLLIPALALCFAWGSAGTAFAVCGDGILDAGEMCDDGNVGDGDCCTSSCQMPGGCFATLGRSGIFIKDKGDDRQDKVFWKLYRAPSSFEDWGDPTAETPYTFCMWDDDELKFQGRIEPSGICHPRRPCWRTLGRVEPQAYRFFDKPTNADGMQRLQLSTKKPPVNGFISLRGVGVNMKLPGPVAFDRYFNLNAGLTVQFHRGDAPLCWEAFFPESRHSDHKRFRASIGRND